MSVKGKIPYELEVLPEDPILIAGCGRSGTTFLLSVLASSPFIYAHMHETQAFEWLPFQLERLKPRGIVQPGQKRWLEKTPLHCRHYGEILEFFDEKVRIINLVRDGRDVCVSEYYGTGEKYFIPPHRWVCDLNASAPYDNHPCVLTVKYETLVTKFRDTIDKICYFTEIATDQREWFYSYPKHTPKKKDPAWKGRDAKSAFTASIGNWKKPEHKATLDKFYATPSAADLLKRYDYEV